MSTTLDGNKWLDYQFLRPYDPAYRRGSHVLMNRKTTATNPYGNGSSFCPWPHKLAAFNWLIHRLVSIPMGRSDFEQEIATLEHLAEVNHVDLDLKRMIRKKMLSIQLNDTTSLLRSPRHDRELRWIRLPFH